MNKNKILELVRKYANEKFGEEEFRPGHVPVSGATIYPEDI